jgi:hypothetical protein
MMAVVRNVASIWLSFKLVSYQLSFRRQPGAPLLVLYSFIVTRSGGVGSWVGYSPIFVKTGLCKFCIILLSYDQDYEVAGHP